MYPGDVALRLVGLIYDAAEQPEVWPMVLKRLASALDSSMGALVTHNLASFRGTAVAAYGADPEVLKGYEESLGHINIYAQRAAARIPPGQAGHGGMLCRDGEVLRTDYYDRFLRPNDWFYVAGGVVAKDSEMVALVSVQRSRSKGHYTREDIDALQLVMPHLERAVRIHSRLHVFQSGIQAVDSLSIGVVGVTAAGKVVFANEYARAVLASGDGLSLDRHGLLISSSKSESLGFLIAKAADASAGRGLHAGGTLSIERGSGAKAYQLTIMPTRSSKLTLSSITPAVIIFIKDPQRHERPPEELLRAYGLTPAERRVALLLSDGAAPRQIADIIAVSENTVRSQIKSIFSKTGVRRQGELMRLLLAHSGATTRL